MTIFMDKAPKISVFEFLDKGCSTGKVYTNILKSEKLKILKQFLCQAFWIRCQPVLYESSMKTYFPDRYRLVLFMEVKVYIVGTV